MRQRLNAIEVARAFGVRVCGIDGMPEFVAHASLRRPNGTCATLRDAVTEQIGYDVVMMLGIGDLLGSLPATIETLARCAKPGGYMVLDDAFRSADAPAEDDSEVPHRATTIGLIESTGVEVVGEQLADTEDMHNWLHRM